VTWSRARVRREVVGLAGYLALVVISFLPQSLRPADTVGYIGDSLDSVYAISRNAAVLTSDPSQLFDAPVLYPHRQTMALFGHRILHTVVAIPVWWATRNPILAYNFVVAAGCLLAAFAGRRLALFLGIGPLGAWAAGALYAFHTFQVNEAPRPDLLFHGPTTFALLGLLRFLESGESRWAWAAALWMTAQGYASNYLVLYGAVILSLVLIAYLVARPGPTLRRLPQLLLPALAATLLFLPVLLPSLRAARLYGFTREPPVGVDLAYFFSTGGGNLLYGPLGTPTGLQSRAPHFIGFLSLALAVWALRLAPTDRAREGRALLRASVWVPAAGALAVLCVLLSLGTEITVFGRTLGPGPYGLLHGWVPGFSFIRLPERFALFAMLFIGLLAGRSIDHLRAVGRPLALGCAILAPLEHVSVLPTTQRVPTGAEVPAVYRWLAARPARAVVELPGNGESLVRKDTLEEYFSLFHGKPIVHGYVSYPPPLSRVLSRAAAEFPSETSLEVFRRVGVDTLLVHHGRNRAFDLAVRAAGALGDLQLVKTFPQPWVIPAPQIWAPSTVGRPPAVPIFTTRTDVYHLPAGTPVAPAPLPRGRRGADAAWRVSASSGHPGHAADRLSDTVWRTDPDDREGIYEITFPQPVRVSGLTIPVSWKTNWPNRFRVEGRGTDGGWARLASLDTPHVLQLVEQLLASPQGGSLGFDLGGASASAIRLRASPGSENKGWALSEVEVWTVEP
jgi:hypothetical protein